MSDRDDVTDDDQTRITRPTQVGLEVVVDRKSLPYLAGATIDFVDGLQGPGFVIDNPNAGGTCACGDSFH